MRHLHGNESRNHGDEDHLSRLQRGNWSDWESRRDGLYREKGPKEVEKRAECTQNPQANHEIARHAKFYYGYELLNESHGEIVAVGVIVWRDT